MFHQAFDSLQTAAVWIYTESSKEGKYLNDQEVEQAAKLLVDQAEQSTSISDMLTMVLGGWAEANIQPTHSRITVKIDDEIHSSIEMANRLLNEGHPSRITESELSRNDYLLRVLGKVRRKRSKKFEIPTREFTQLRDYYERKANASWQYPEDWSLGDYTFGDLRRLWTTLVAMTFIHLQLHKQELTRPEIKTFRTGRWVSELTRRTGLRSDIVERIVQDLTYNVALYTHSKDAEKGKKIPHVLSQPFFPLTDGTLALSNAAVVSSNIEVVLFDLLSVIRPKLFSKNSKEKEERWKERLIDVFRNRGIASYGPFNVSFNEESTNLDLLLVDHKDKFGLVCELKWLKPHDRLRDVTSNQKELIDGCKKAALCVGWLKSDLTNLEKRIPDKSISWKDYDFEGIVLSRNSLGDSRVHIHEIPVMNQFLLEAVLEPPHSKNLRTVYKVAKEKTYLPRKGVHYFLENIESEYAGYSVIGENIGVKLGNRPWNKEVDLRFDS